MTDNNQRIGYQGLESLSASPRSLGSPNHDFPRGPPGSPNYPDSPTRPPQSPMRTHSASPRPPSSARTRSRPKSSRYRLRAASLDLDAASQMHTPSPPATRPTSSFSRHPALPPIGTKIAPVDDIIDKMNDMDLKSIQQDVKKLQALESSNYNASHTHDTQTEALSLCSDNLVTQPCQPVESPLKQSYDLPTEPSENEERILLAVKLSDGKRLQRYFRKSETFYLILQFASMECDKDLLGCKLVDNATRTTFDDTSTKINDAGLADRTMLYIEIPDD
ncbi:unnamed protein product [Owenia fusiformis]|uniref:Uncharacterized protein n=1 Tax=Owenia fusiformis TaxID=6347 RepID=A0A8J1XRY9_OWEFU|nr:unnamed protein product [Owenia fusiformis]